MAATIESIEVVGSPVQVWDHTQKLEPLDFADGGVFAWRDVDGKVSLGKPMIAMYRLKGTSLLNVGPEAGAMFRSQDHLDPIFEGFSYNHFMGFAYSDDGVNFYGVAHMEWAAVLQWDAEHPGDTELFIPSANGFNSYGNSQVTSLTMLASSDKGDTWHHHPSHGNNLVASPGFRWIPSTYYTTRPHTWLFAQNDTGLGGIVSRLLKEVSPTDGLTYYYAMCALGVRDFTTINQAAGQYQAAQILNNARVLIRTTNFKSPTGWQVRLQNGTWVALSTEPDPLTWYRIEAFVERGWYAGMFQDLTTGLYVVNYPATHNDEQHQPANNHAAVRFSTTPSLETPVWSTPKDIVGSAELVTDNMDANGNHTPAANWLGFNDPNYPVILDPDCPGFNFDAVSVGGTPWMFWSTYSNSFHGRGSNDSLRTDIWRAQLHITYGGQQLGQAGGDLVSLVESVQRELMQPQKRRAKGFHASSRRS